MTPTGTAVVPLDDLSAAYMVTDLRGRIRAANARLREWVGGGSNVESMTIQGLLTASSVASYESVVVPSLTANGELSDVAFELDLEQGVRHTVWAATVAREDEVHWIGIDITDRRRQDLELIAVERRLARLERLSSHLLSAGSVESIGEVLLSHVVDGVKADRGIVAIGDGTGELEVVAGQSLSVTLPLPPSPGDDALVAASMARGVPLFDTLPTTGADDGDLQAAAIPLMSEDGVVGVVSLRLARATPHSAEEQDLLVAAADITSASIARARLHARLQLAAQRDASLSALLHAMEAETTVRDRARCMADRLVPEYGCMAAVDLSELAPDLAGLRHVDRSLEPTVRRAHDHLRASSATPVRPGLDADDRLRVAYAEVVVAELAPDVAKAVDELGLQSLIRVPLVARARRIGTLTLGSATLEGVSQDVREFYGRLADACALSLDNARLYEEERGIARQLQEVLLPDRLPADPRFRLHHFYESGRDAFQVGGDWYDAFLIGRDRLGVTVGDVVGGGITAARTMGKLRTVARAFAVDGRGVAETLAGVHRFASTEDDAVASSMIYAEVDLTQRTIEYASAGHLPPVLVAPGADPELLSGGRGILLGLNRERTLQVATAAIPEGSTIVMYTDGLVERPSRVIDDSIRDLQRILRDDPTLATRPDALACATASVERTDDTCVLSLTLT